MNIKLIYLHNYLVENCGTSCKTDKIYKIFPNSKYISLIFIQFTLESSKSMLNYGILKENIIFSLIFVSWKDLQKA